MWQPLLVIGENRYRISSSGTDANSAWESIKAQFLNDDSEEIEEIDLHLRRTVHRQHPLDETTLSELMRHAEP